MPPLLHEEARPSGRAMTFPVAYDNRTVIIGQSGNSGYVYAPSTWIGKKAVIVLIEPPNPGPKRSAPKRTGRKPTGKRKAS